MVQKGTSCIKVFLYLKCVLRWWSELSEFCSWHSWSEKLEKNYIKNQNTLQKRIAVSRLLLEENPWEKYWQCSVETSHSIFYFETTFCLEFFFYFVLAFLLQHNINFKKSKSKQNVSVSITTKPVNQLEIHWGFFNSPLLRISDFGGFIAIQNKVNFRNLEDL